MENELINNVIEEAAEKFEYTEELKDVLKRIIPIMAEEKSEESRELLYQTLRIVPILIIDSDRPTEEDLKQLRLKTFGREDLIIQDTDRGEYNTGSIAPGAYEYDVILNEQGKPKGMQGFVYASRLCDSQKELEEIYGTNINLSHLIHEIGHAWAATKNNFTQIANNTYSHNIGTIRETIIQDEQTGEIKIASYDGLILEEMLNTILEEDTLIKLLGIEKIEDLTGKGYVRSGYQGLGPIIVRKAIEKFGTEGFENYRLIKDKESIKSINQKMKNTKAYSTMITERYSKEKKQSVEENIIQKLEISDRDKDIIRNFFSKYDDVYFANNATMTPIQKLDNVLEQIFSLKDVRYTFGLVQYKDGKIVKNENNDKIYGEFMMSITKEAMGMINGVQVEKGEQGMALEEP